VLLMLRPVQVQGLLPVGLTFCGGTRMTRQMRLAIRLALLASLIPLASASHAVDRGQFENVPEHIRSWFKGVRSRSGVPCCDMSDGHRTEYDVRDGAYWVPIEGEWMQVPDKAIIRDGGNPVGEAVVWYVRHGGNIIISCFVPADAA
jgi:hypothetical protein